MTPSVSVVIPTFNGERYIAEAIESVRAQSFTDWELLLVDDGSHDGSAAILVAAEHVYSLGYLMQPDDVTRARCDALAAPGALFAIDHRQPLRAHVDRVKRTDDRARTKAKAAVAALRVAEPARDLWNDRRTAVADTLILVPVGHLTRAATAVDDRNLALGDIATDDTRVRTAIAWLEEAGLVRREENSVQLFPSSLRIKDLAEAELKLTSHLPAAGYCRRPAPPLRSARPPSAARASPMPRPVRSSPAQMCRSSSLPPRRTSSPPR